MVTKEDYQQDIGINSDWKFPNTPFTSFWNESLLLVISDNSWAKEWNEKLCLKEPEAGFVKSLLAERIKYHYKTVIL
jgi:hypothetical protein